MIKEHAELLAKKERERKVDLSRMTSYPEYYTLKEELEKMLATLNNNDCIDLESKVDVSAQVLANRLAKEKITRFLADVGAYTVKASDTVDRTYS